MIHTDTHRFTGSGIFSRRAGALASIGALVLILGGAIVGLRANTQHASVVPGGEANAASVRIGTYDSRAIAVAYVRSDASAAIMQDLLRQRSEAEMNGDKKTVEKLNARGESMQIRNHLQGFSTAPVDDILEAVRDKLQGVAERNSIVVITRSADYHDASVEVIDVTDDLVQLFMPDAQTLKIIAELRHQQPMAIEAAAKLSAKG